MKNNLQTLTLPKLIFNSLSQLCESGDIVSVLKMKSVKKLATQRVGIDDYALALGLDLFEMQSSEFKTRNGY